MKAFRVFEAVAAVGTLLLAGYTLLLAFEIRASNKLLNAICSISPGVSISDVRVKIGKQEMYEVSDTGGILALGSVKNASFCEGKILYWFAISAPPCRVLEVYTDQSKKVCFVTWQPQ